MTDYSIRPGAADNTNLFLMCNSDHEPRKIDLASFANEINGKFVMCQGTLAKFNSEISTDTKFFPIAATGSFEFSFKLWNRDFDALSSNIALVELLVTCRYFNGQFDLYKVYVMPSDDSFGTFVVPEHKAGLDLLTFSALNCQGDNVKITVTNTNTVESRTTITARYINDARMSI